MRKLALSDDILLKIDKPARYLGNEINAVMKNPEDVDIRFVMAFPDIYEIGMSYLGIQIIYDMLNSREDTWCERCGDARKEYSAFCAGVPGRCPRF